MVTDILRQGITWLLEANLKNNTPTSVFGANWTVCVVKFPAIFIRANADCQNNSKYVFLIPMCLRPMRLNLTHQHVNTTGKKTSPRLSTTTDLVGGL